MIVGTVTDDGVLIITLSIAEQYLPATIDTGFNGDLELPEVLRNSLNACYVCEVLEKLWKETLAASLVTNTFTRDVGLRVI